MEARRLKGGDCHMRQFLIEFLKALEAEVPPPPNCHHVLTFARFGSDEDGVGWSDQLALQVNLDGEFVAFFLEEVDFQKPIGDLVAYIAKQCSPIDGAQLGVGVGQFIA